MLVLGIETATDVCSVALHDGNVALGEASLRQPRRHAARLMPLIRDVLAHAGCETGDLDGVAVSSGPGSYTGLRIGVSTAKGLAVATGAALIAVPTLEALAWQIVPMTNPGDYIVAALPSRRGEVYAAGYRNRPATARFEAVAGAEAAALRIDEAGAWWEQAAPDATRVWLVGPAGLQLAGDDGLDCFECRWVPPYACGPSAASVAFLGFDRAFHHADPADLDSGALRSEDVASFEPSYLKEFVAGKPRPLF